MPIGINNVAPGDPMTAMSRRIADLERTVRELAAAPALQNATIAQGGIQITNGGSVKVIDTGGNVTAQMGALPAQYNRSDGTPQPGLRFCRPDGTIALFIGDLSPTVPPYNAAFQVSDRAGRIVLADDTNSGHGLAAPHIDAGGMYDTNALKWPATTNATFTTIAFKYYEVQNARVTWQIQMYADAGITAQYRLLMSGAQAGTTQTIPAGTITNWSTDANLPAGVTVGSVVLVELQALSSATSGSARAQCLRFSGQQS